jgi:hypothetical protein
MTKIMIFVSLLVATFVGCFPTGSSDSNNSNNTNNLNNINNINNLNNINNINNENNLNNINNSSNNLNNLNNVNNTNTVNCGNGGICQEWQECVNDDHCELSSGRCENSIQCGDYDFCDSSHVCIRDVPGSCSFSYENDFPSPRPGSLKSNNLPIANLRIGDGAIDHAPAPSGYFLLSQSDSHQKKVSVDQLIMPDYSDNMPLFSRAIDWGGVPRCYETPEGAELLFEAEAYDLYIEMVETTLGVVVNKTPEFRTVIGLRGAYPGSFNWNYNSPDYFNDTMVLIWVETGGVKRVKEFPVNTDTGDNTYTSTSSLLPNRIYKYQNGTHRGYNALAMFEYNYGREYHTADDANANGHWDNSRNGWLDTSSGKDFVRVGSAHNIHMGSVNAPLGSAHVAGWSAGCQVHPGMANWTEFITNAWTSSGDIVDYFVVDSRDIDIAVWGLSCTPDGSHDCPWVIDSLPYSHNGNTDLNGTSQFDTYGCSTSNESGPEVVYVFKSNQVGTLHVSVDCNDPVDIDIHLLSMDDPDSCLVRDHMDFSWDIVPGRYLIIADTYVSGTTELSGAFTLNVSLN